MKSAKIIALKIFALYSRVKTAKSLFSFIIDTVHGEGLETDHVSAS